jgi:integrase
VGVAEHYDPQVGHYFVFMFETGLRPSEAIALEWGDVDFGSRTIRISRAIVAHAEKGTKTDRARNVDLTEKALQTLIAQKQYSFFSQDQKIFQNPNTGHGWASSKRQSELYWRPALKALGIRHRPAYNCRHSFACWQLTDGLPVGYVAQQLGHSSITTTLQHYGKWMQSSNSEMLERRNHLAKKKAEAQKKTG